MEQEEKQAQSLINTETEESVVASEKDTTTPTTSNNTEKDTDKETKTVAASCEKTMEAPDNVSNLPAEFYHYYYGSNLDMGRLIEVRFNFFFFFISYLKEVNSAD